jgi:Domain of unknown function (DUF222)
MHESALTDNAETVLAELHAVLDRAAGRVAVALDPREQRDWLLGLQAVRARVESLCCQTAAGAERAALPQAEGLFSVGSLIARHTNADAAVAGRDRRLGLWLADFDRIADAFATGVLTRRHVDALRQATTPRTYTALLDSQAWLVEQAERLDYREFTAVLRYWVLAADPDGEEPRVQALRRHLSLHRGPDGMMTSRFILDPLAGQSLATAVAQENKRLLAEDEDAPAPRTTSQRQADALTRLVARGAARPDGSMPAPLIHLVMSQAVAERAIAEPGETVGLEYGSLDGRCELVDGTPIHPRHGAALLAVATLRRLVLGADREILDLSRKVRGFPAHLKQALLAAARGRCQVPGCDAPLPWLEADHLLPWIRGNPTATANGQIRCGPHNRAKSDQLPTTAVDFERIRASG